MNGRTEAEDMEREYQRMADRDEIASLREAISRLAEQDATLSVQNGNVTVTMDATLTPEERDAVETAAMEADAHQHTQRAATLRGLLDRLGGGV